MRCVLPFGGRTTTKAALIGATPLDRWSLLVAGQPNRPILRDRPSFVAAVQTASTADQAEPRASHAGAERPTARSGPPCPRWHRGPTRGPRRRRVPAG